MQMFNSGTISITVNGQLACTFMLHLVPAQPLYLLVSKPANADGSSLCNFVPMGQFST